MIAFAYIVPLLSCLILRLYFEYDGAASAFFWIFIIGESLVALFHWMFYHNYISCTEYLGALLTDIVHENSWTELIEVTETRKDRNGKSYTVTRIEEKFHPEKYYFHTTRGSEIETDYSFFSYVRNQWRLSGAQLRWKGKRIKGGVRYGLQFEMSEFEPSERENPKNWIPITERGSYTNKIRTSNSIFKFERIGKSEADRIGLINYPQINRYDSPCVLSRNVIVPLYVDELFRKFNARYAPEIQMRLYILLFESSKGIGISELQRAYWQGGNKNEFIICIGVDSLNEVIWARAFSWTDEQTKEIETAQWLMQHPALDWHEFHDWLRYHLIDWNRKEFKDFDYIQVSLPLWQILTIIFLSIAENALAIWIAIN
ncbi:MAG: hypothetical protein K2M77_03535 [Muribaculaceae bacterium]|nr:hypothetical protein [Muribaculaceae bacterium]